MNSSITLTREQSYADRLRAYRVLLDDTEIGRLGYGESKTFAVPPGQHQIRLTIDWCGSNTVTFHVEDGQTLSFDCGSALQGLRLLLALFYALFAWNSYLWIRPVST